MGIQNLLASEAKWPNSFGLLVVLITLTWSLTGSMAIGQESLPPALSKPVVPNPVDSQPSPSDAKPSVDKADDKEPAEKVPSDRSSRDEVPNSQKPTDKTRGTQTQEPTELTNRKVASQDSATVGKSENDSPRKQGAQATDPVSRELQRIAIGARGELSQSKLPQIEPAKMKLTEALEKLDRFLGTNPAEVEQWSKFLRLDILRKELKEDRPDPNLLVDLEMTMRQNYLGLEYAPMTNVRQGLVDLSRALKFSSNPEATIKSLDARLERLVEALNEPLTDADTERAEAVGVIANYLHESGQAASSVEAMRSKFSQPNVQLYVREGFVNRLVLRPVAQPSPVNECLLGTHVVGNAFLSGNVTADLMPSHHGVTLSLNLNANMTSNNVGFNRGVVLRSTGQSPIHASKVISVTPNGISSSPATVASDLQTQIYSIEHRLRIVRRIAKRKAAETQPKANVIAEGRLQNRVQAQFDEQVEQQLTEARIRLASLQGRQVPEIKRIGLTRPSYSAQSTSEAVVGTLTQSTPSQLAAGRSNRLVKLPQSDVFVAAHQSALMNSLDVLLGGRTLRSADLDDLVRQAGGQVSADVLKEANGPLWSVTFASFHPIQIELDEKRIKLTLRLSQMTRGEQVLKQNAIISATYRPSYYDNRLRLDREGPVSIDFVGRSTGVASVSLRAFLKGKFEETFKPVLVDTYIDLPQLAPNLPKFRVSSIQIDRGWLQVGIK